MRSVAWGRFTSLQSLSAPIYRTGRVSEAFLGTMPRYPHPYIFSPWPQPCEPTLLLAMAMGHRGAGSLGSLQPLGELSSPNGLLDLGHWLMPRCTGGEDEATEVGNRGDWS